MRSGVLARKLGMSRVFSEDGGQVAVTVLALDGCLVVGQRLPERDGYRALRVGAGARRAKNVAKPQRREFAALGVEVCAETCEFRIGDDMLVDVGSEFSAAHFVVGQKVDVAGITKGRGFTGSMRRWGFSGLRASHGVSISHRSHGSTGQCQDPGKVFKGKKMAGRYGGDRKTTHNLEVVRTDPERGLILVRGAVAGARNSFVRVRDAVKSPRPDAAPVPAGLRAAASSAGEKENGADPSAQAEGTGNGQ